MSTAPTNVLVFGGAGAVGRAAATSASQRGAKVWLAMRDPKKTIPGLSKSDEEKQGFERIKADLSDPTSLKSAVATSQAKIAFVYAIVTAEDAMKSAFETLRDSGITTIVILSSFTVHPSAEAAKNYDFIPRAHAQVELQLIKSGVKYVSVRPGYFNSNIFWYLEAIKAGEVKIFGKEARFDFIAPEDIGAVVGTLLTNPSTRGPENEPNGKSIYLYGPKLMSRVEALGIVSSVLGKEIKVADNDEDGFWEEMKDIPRPVAESIFKGTKASTPPNSEYEEKNWNEGAGNILKYAEREPMAFTQWVEAHKEGFM
jgi:uncharacterized protein YbjT (DUF2867 family)